MERKTFTKAHIYVRDAYKRAGKLAAEGNYQEAIDVLVPVIQENPEIPALYERLREYEVIAAKKKNPLVKIGCQLLALFIYPAIKITAGVDPIKAMAMCEKPLAACVDNPLILSVLADAADNADAPWVAATALEVNRVFRPNNEGNLRRLAIALQDSGRANESLRIFQELIRKHPGNLSIQNEMREAMAMASIERGNWEAEGSTQQKAADADDAVIQQLLEGTIHDSEQATLLINKFTADLQKNDSIDIRRKLAEAYMVAQKYDDALREFRAVAEKLGVPDPLLDKQIERAYLAGLEQAVGELRAHPDQYENAEQQATALEAEMLDYRRRHAIKRAEMFPNDVQVQFDLGEFYFETGEIAKSKEIFTKLVDFPQKRRASLVYLGRCALLEKDFARAVECLDSALTEMYRMDRYRREALYYLGNACEGVGDNARALKCYQDIEASVSGYRDVHERIAALGGSAPEAK
jgi:tetratricopeptide (TPR) repeat protein